MLTHRIGNQLLIKRTSLFHFFLVKKDAKLSYYGQEKFMLPNYENKNHFPTHI